MCIVNIGKDTKHKTANNNPTINASLTPTCVNNNIITTIINAIQASKPNPKAFNNSSADNFLFSILSANFGANLLINKYNINSFFYRNYDCRNNIKREL